MSYGQEQGHSEQGPGAFGNGDTEGQMGESGGQAVGLGAVQSMLGQIINKVSNDYTQLLTDLHHYNPDPQQPPPLPPTASPMTSTLLNKHKLPAPLQLDLSDPSDRALDLCYKMSRSKKQLQLSYSHRLGKSRVPAQGAELVDLLEGSQMTQNGRRVGAIVRVRGEGQSRGGNVGKIVRRDVQSMTVQHNSPEILQQGTRRVSLRLPPLSPRKSMQDKQTVHRQLYILQKSKRATQLYQIKKFLKLLILNCINQAVDKIQQKRSFFSYRLPHKNKFAMKIHAKHAHDSTGLKGPREGGMRQSNNSRILSVLSVTIDGRAGQQHRQDQGEDGENVIQGDDVAEGEDGQDEQGSQAQPSQGNHQQIEETKNQQKESSQGPSSSQSQSQQSSASSEPQRSSKEAHSQQASSPEPLNLFTNPPPPRQQKGVPVPCLTTAHAQKSSNKRRSLVPMHRP